MPIPLRTDYNADLFGLPPRRRKTVRKPGDCWRLLQSMSAPAGPRRLGSAQLGHRADRAGLSGQVQRRWPAGLIVTKSRRDSPPTAGLQPIVRRWWR